MERGCLGRDGPEVLKLCSLFSAIMGETASDVAAVVWDIDGTLCDSFRLAYGATGVVLARHGRAANVSEAEYHRSTRYSTPERLARHLAPELGLDAESTSSEQFIAAGAGLASEFDALYISRVTPESACRGSPPLVWPKVFGFPPVEGGMMSRRPDQCGV